MLTVLEAVALAFFIMTGLAGYLRATDNPAAFW